MKRVKVMLVGLVGCGLVTGAAEAVPFTSKDADDVFPAPTIAPSAYLEVAAPDVTTHVPWAPPAITVDLADALDFVGQTTQSSPEPTALALMGVGIAGMALMLWWRRRGHVG